MDEVINKKVIVVDICNTIYDSNTTYDFIRYCIESNKFPKGYKLLYRSMLLRVSPLFWAIAITQKLLKKDLFKLFVVSFLKNRTTEEVNNLAEIFYNDYLSKRLINSVLTVIKKFPLENIILVSATLKPIAAIIAKKLGINNFLASELEIKNNRYTGKVLNELTGQKLAALYKHIHKNLKIDVVITDNLSDKNLMCQAEEGFAVCYNPKQELFWSKLKNVTILRVSTDNYRP